MNRSMRWGMAVMGLLALAAPTAALAETPAPNTPAEQLVVTFLDTTFNQKKPDDAFAAYVGPYYRQHNPTVADGKDAIIGALHQWLPTVPALHYDIVHLVSSGDLVAVHSHVTTSPQDRGMAVVDIFRVENGKVVEHWDVGQPVPEKSANTNTMF